LLQAMKYVQAQVGLHWLFALALLAGGDVSAQGPRVRIQDEEKFVAEQRPVRAVGPAMG
jgi:hypothetical protein